MNVYKKMKKILVGVLMCGLLNSNMMVQAALFDTSIKLFVDSASKEVQHVIATDLYPRVNRLIKQSAIAFVGAMCCSYGISLFTAQCEKRTIFADSKRIGVSGVLIALGSSLIIFSDRLVIHQ